jgi:septal ring-binding cell division protein DamX/type II secretory pathway predicted ATPase ExeA
MIDKSTYDTEQLDRLEPAYLANYGLTEAPFSNLHDDRFLYLDAERAQRLNLLQHMTQYSNLLLIVQGERGVGKTSLLTRFVKNKADNWHICDVTANTMMDAGQLLFQAAQGFGLQQLPQDSGELQEMLYAQIATYHHNDQIPILVIDDAHELPKDALLAIFHLADAQVDNANLLRIILFAEPQIEKMLNAKDVRSLRERITHTMEIPPLDEDTTAEYLKHRMAVAGFNGGSPFTPKMVKRIFKASGGVPEQINKLAHETLDKGDFGREEVEDIVVPTQAKRSHKTSVLIGIGVVVLALVLVFQSRINRLFEDKAPQTKTLSLPLAEKAPVIQPEVEHKQPPAPSATPAGTSTPAVTTAPAAEQPQVEQKIIPLHPAPATPASQASEATTAQPVSPPSPEKQTPAATEITTVPAAVAPPTEPQAVKAVPVPTVSLTSVTPNPLPASNAPQTITVNGEGFTPHTRVFVSWADKDHEIPPARVKLVNDKQLQLQLTVGTRHENWQVHVTDSEHGNSNTLAFKVATASLLKQQVQDWVLAQEPGTFTLQLFGSHEQKNAEAFIRQHHLGQAAHVFVSERKGKDWYSVVYGVYPDQAAASSASKTLPASLKKIKPWVRRFDDIQASINASRKLTQQQKNKPVAKPATIFTTTLPKKADIKQYESWLWSQDPRYFTLQLTGARELDSIKKFLHQHANLDGRAIYFHTRHDGRDWYAVVYGVYADKQKAREAIKRLPAALQKASPWIRSFASIHAELARTE